jgi:NADPH:quinone reductase-like Zn-dependent oxidoreductase
VKAVFITRPGPPGVLELRDLPDPRCGPEQVRVQGRAAGLNRADLLQRRGLYPARPGSPQEIRTAAAPGGVGRCFPFEAAAVAHAYMESNRNFGKIVLRVGRDS